MEGGVGAFTQELSRALAAQGHQLHIITSYRARPSNPYLRAANGTDPTSRVKREPGEPFDLGFAQLYPFINRWRWPSMNRIADLALRYEFDLINIQYQPAAYNMKSGAINLLPWRLAGILPTAVTFHDLRQPFLFPKAGRLRQTAVDFLARHASGVIATNQADQHQLARKTSAPVAQIPIGSNIQVYPATAEQLTAVRQQLGLQPNDQLLAYFGFLNQSKGADLLLQMLARLPEQVHLLFVGGRAGSSDEANNNAFYAQLDAQINQLGLGQRIHWTGFLPDDQVSLYLQAADLMVMPYRDGVSLRRGTLMAGLAHGRVVLTTPPTTATPELVHGQTIWLAPADDVAAFAQACQSLLADADLRATIGQAAAQLARLFSWDQIAQQTAVFFQQLLQNKPKT